MTTEAELDFLESLRVPEGSTNRLGLNPLAELRVPEEKSIPSDAGDLFAGYPSNVVESGANRVDEFWEMLTSPVQTGKAIYEVGKGFGNKGKRVFSDMLWDTETEPNPDDEFAADMVIDAFLDRWGSKENAMHTLYNDPVGAMLDATGLLSSIPMIGTRLAKGTDIVGQTGRAIQDGLNAGQRTLPERMYAQSMGIPQSELINSRGSEVVPEGLAATREGLREGIGRTTRGYQKLLDLRESIGEQINGIIQSGMNNMQMIPTQSVGKYLDAMVREARSGKWDMKDLKTLQGLRDDFYTQFGDRPNMTPMQVQEWKKSRYDKAYAGEASPMASDRISADTVGNRAMGRGAKEGIENRLPQITDPNTQYGDLSKLKPYVERAINAGSGSTDLGMFRTVMEKLPTTRAAIILEKIAKGDMGEAEMYLNTPQLRTAIEMAGRAREMMEEDTNLYDK